MVWNCLAQYCHNYFSYPNKLFLYHFILIYFLVSFFIPCAGFSYLFGMKNYIWGMKLIGLEPPGCVAVMPYEEKKQASGLLSRLGRVCHRAIIKLTACLMPRSESILRVPTGPWPAVGITGYFAARQPLQRRTKPVHHPPSTLTSLDCDFNLMCR